MPTSVRQQHQLPCFIPLQKVPALIMGVKVQPHLRRGSHQHIACHPQKKGTPVMGVELCAKSSLGKTREAEPVYQPANRHIGHPRTISLTRAWKLFFTRSPVSSTS